MVILTQVALAGNDCIAVWAVELGHILSVFLQDVHLHGAALGKASVADVALVGLLPCTGKDRTVRQGIQFRCYETHSESQYEGER